MSVRRLAQVQPESFEFTAENQAWAKTEIGKYPEGRKASAVLALLWRAQAQNEYWLPEPAIRHVADMLGMAYIRVLEVATFYTMFNLEPVGRHFVQLCGTTPCWLCGADDLKAVCRKVIGEPGRVSADGAFSWTEVECLGACSNAPMVQINDDYYEDLTAESFEKLLEDLRAGRKVKTGSQTGRVSSEPLGGPFTLTELGKSKAKRKPASKPAKKAAPKPVKAPVTPATATERAPQLFTSAPTDGADDLKRISGVGPKLEGVLNGLGIYRFDQIAAWTAEHIAWVDARLKFKGRIERDDWIGQAKALARGGGEG
ncbi:NADH-ubiquinone oxidoreductase chain E [hydrothermal vent metagenome]|uniref:NADH-ubiquinone oxidoreductase chain E n=1 Tax=hydrothermal vent metagenome TaxID=652676 RepID=A0A3B0TWP9_9ZZZZ